MNPLLRGVLPGLLFLGMTFAQPLYPDLTAKLRRTQVSLNTTPLHNGFNRWTTVNRWTNTGSVPLNNAYFLYLGQDVSTNGGKTFLRVAWDNANRRWQAANITATPVSPTLYLQLSPANTNVSLPQGSGLSTSSIVAAYRLGNIPAGAFVDVPIARDITDSVNVVTSTVLTAILVDPALETRALAHPNPVQSILVQRKVALLIGNAAYSKGALKNPVNDVDSMEIALKKLDFDEVRTLRNGTRRQMTQEIDRFVAGLTSGSLALFYYSGHGMQVNDSNYLLPVDFDAASEADVEYEAYPARRVQDKLEQSGARLRVLVFDACRNNPYRFKRDAGGGLAPMAVNAEGTIIGYATGDNNVADDNPNDSNGLYTKHLVPALQTPGLQLREIFQKAKEEVFLASQRVQNPSIYENIVGQFYLAGAARIDTSRGPAIVPSRFNAEEEAWAVVKDSQDPSDFDTFMRSFPASDLVPFAQIRARQLRRDRSSPPANQSPPKQ